MAAAQKRRAKGRRGELTCYLDTRRGLTNLPCFKWKGVYDVERPETSEDSRNITDDVI